MKKIATVWITTVFILLFTSTTAVFASGIPTKMPVWQENLLISANKLSNPSTNMLFIDARSGDSAKAFIPNSIRINWSKFYAGQTLKPQSEISTLLGSYGISGKEEIVIYDDGAGKGSASMVFWLLDMSGHPNVKILNGGWQAYVGVGLKTDQKLMRLKSAGFNMTAKPQAVMNMKDMLTHYGDDNLSIVDPRSDEEYIGWKLHGEKRGGHIRTAVNFSPLWAYEKNGTVKNADVLRTLLFQKGLTPEKKFLVYSNLDARGTDMYFLLRLMGYQNVAHLGFSYNVWAETARLPVSGAPNYQALVSPQWVNQLITTGKAPTYNNKKFVVLEASWGTLENAAKEYKISHIPGAIHFDTDTFEDEKNYWDLFAFDELAARFAKEGIDKETTVVVYSHEPSPIAASISFWALKYAGVDVRLLNGNFERWVSLGLPVETKINHPSPVAAFGLSKPANPQYTVSTEQAKEILANPDGRMVSIRSWPEYTGEVSRHAYIKAKGEIDGSYWGRAGFGENKSDLSFYTDLDGSYRSYTEVEKMWLDLDIRPNNQVAFYCGTGSRGSTGWFFSHLMGWPRSAVYDSGWYGWSEGKEVSPNPSQRLQELAK